MHRSSARPSGLPSPGVSVTLTSWRELLKLSVVFTAETTTTDRRVRRGKKGAGGGVGVGGRQAGTTLKKFRFQGFPPQPGSFRSGLG